jgi:hypothetical protein
LRRHRLSACFGPSSCRHAGPGPRLNRSKSLRSVVRHSQLSVRCLGCLGLGSSRKSLLALRFVLDVAEVRADYPGRQVGHITGTEIPILGMPRPALPF